MKFSWRDLCGPNPNPMSCNECSALQDLVSVLPKNPIIVQIGAERGTSTLAMLEARPDAFIYSIDKGECVSEFTNLQKAGLPVNRVERILGISQDVGITWDTMCDMLFIDGDHRCDPVKEDIRLYRPWVKSGGVIAFHDYIPEPIPPEIKGRVVYAVDEMMTEEYKEIVWIERLKAFQMP